MADVKQILVVDDHFEMLQFLRSMLELSQQKCEVLAVPSAEEGLLELRQTDFDLMITDVRLPGMSGFDLVQRVRKLGRTLPVIMITAYASPEGRQEAEGLDVFRYYEKPLDTDEVITAVNLALHGTKTGTAPLQSLPAADTVPAELQKRLQALQSDIGAASLVLATVSGEMIVQLGVQRPARMEELAALMALNLQTSFRLGAAMASKEPFTLQHHAGEQEELYFANVGGGHFLAMFFDVRARRGRIGTIWVFTQRAIKDLIPLLPAADARGLPGVAAPPVDRQTAARSVAEGTAVPEENPELHRTREQLNTPPSGETVLDIPPDQLADLLNNAAVDTADVEAFWEDAADMDAAAPGRGLSFAEAMEQGLIPEELDLDEE